MSLQFEAPVSFSQHQLLAEQGSFMEELYSGTWNLDHSSEMQAGNTGLGISKWQMRWVEVDSDQEKKKKKSRDSESKNNSLPKWSARINNKDEDA